MPKNQRYHLALFLVHQAIAFWAALHPSAAAVIVGVYAGFGLFWHAAQFFAASPTPDDGGDDDPDDGERDDIPPEEETPTVPAIAIPRGLRDAA